MKKRCNIVRKRRRRQKYECKCDKRGGEGIPLLLLRHELHENAHYRALAGKHGVVVARPLLPLLLRLGEEVVDEFKVGDAVAVIKRGGGGEGNKYYSRYCVNHTGVGF